MRVFQPKETQSLVLDPRRLEMISEEKMPKL